MDIEEQYDKIFRFCYYRVHNADTAQDLTQETFLRFVRSGGHHKGGRPIAYLMRTARSVCIDASRERRLETASLDFDVATEDSPYNDSGLIEALSKLPPVLLEVIELRYGADLEVGDVARVLGISRFSVRRRIRRALALLEEEMGWFG